MLEKFGARLPEIRRGADECWPYSDSAVRQNWYGRVSCGNNRQRNSDFHQVVAHRVSWVYFNGPLANESVVMHQCDYKPCVNPAHLVAGSQGENIAEAYERGMRTSSQGKTWKWKTTENHWRNRAKAERDNA